MKKNLLIMLGLMTLFSGCKNTPIDYNEGYKLMGSLNVSDAKTIYKKSSPSRAGEGAGDAFYKIDFDGNEVKLVIKDKEGRDHNLEITQIVKLTKDYIVVYPFPPQIIEIIVGGDPYDYYPWGRFASLVNVKTEKMYNWPDDAEINVTNECGNKVSDTDKDGNIYFSVFGGPLYKLNVSDYTIENIGSEGQKYTYIDVTNDGFVLYERKYLESSYTKIQCPGGRIYPFKDILFTHQKEAYVVKDNKIYHLQAIGNNELKEEAICNITEHPSNYGDPNQYRIVENPIRKTSLIIDNSNQGHYYEFDGSSCKEINIEGHPVLGVCSTSNAWFALYDDGRFIKTRMKDYSYSEIPTKDYEIVSTNQMTFSSDSPEVSFVATRYMDGKKVVGKITDNDEIVVESESENNKEITQLIQIN